MRCWPIMLACLPLLVVAIGCVSSSTQDVSKVQVLDATRSTAASSNLLDLDSKLDDVYTTQMANIKAKVVPEEKKLIDILQSAKPNAKSLLAKDHSLFQKALEDCKDGMIALSSSTSTNVDPMEHDKYIAYFTAIGEVMSSRRDLYQDILDYEQHPDEQHRLVILDQARVVQGKELTYTEKKR